MSLKSRLNHLRQQTGQGAPQAKPAVDAVLAQRLSRIRDQRLHGQDASIAHKKTDDTQLAQRLEGEIISPGIIGIEKSIPLAGKHGHIALQNVQARPQLPGNAIPVNRRLVYLDTETTGLSTGSGTLAFLIGIAELTPQHIKVTQLLLTRFTSEAELLSQLLQRLRNDVTLVSYNGKTYDLPLLISRFRMQGLSQRVAELPHIDLLHPVRRLFSDHWPDCRLATVENRLLSFNRQDDLPGSEAPAAWFSYVRTQLADNLLRVVEHNYWDLVSLCVMHSELERIVTVPEHKDLSIPGLARWLEQHDETAALRLLEKHQQRLCADGLRLLANYLRRAAQWSEAAAIWETLSRDGCKESTERLAKYHEHISRDLNKAIFFCNQLTQNKNTEHRRKRLARKLSQLKQTHPRSAA